MKMTNENYDVPPKFLIFLESVWEGVFSNKMLYNIKTEKKMNSKKKKK